MKEGCRKPCLEFEARGLKQAGEGGRGARREGYLQKGLGTRGSGLELHGQHGEEDHVEDGGRGVPEGPRHPKLQQIG